MQPVAKQIATNSKAVELVPPKISAAGAYAKAPSVASAKERPKSFCPVSSSRSKSTAGILPSSHENMLAVKGLCGHLARANGWPGHPKRPLKSCQEGPLQGSDRSGTPAGACGSKGKGTSHSAQEPAHQHRHDTERHAEREPHAKRLKIVKVTMIIKML